MDSVISRRIERLQEAIEGYPLDLLVVLCGENRRYLSGFTAEDHQMDESAGALLIGKGVRMLLTDSRFEIQARQEAPDFELFVYKKGLSEELPSVLTRLGAKRVGFESVRMSVQQHEKILESARTAGLKIEFIPTQELVETLRIRKNADEIAATGKALTLAETVWDAWVVTLRPGMTEKQAAWELEKRLREAGADGLSFPTIVAGGPNAALPHAIASDRPFRTGEPILFDWGVRLNGYCSDISRTVILASADERFRAVYETVRGAQEAAIGAIREGVTGKAVDQVARDFIDATGFKGMFGHGLGHGTGLAVHEAPRLSPLSPHTLQKGMICTVEPGIYIEGWGGVRIENQVVVETDGPVVLNRLDTRLRVIDV